MTQPTTHETHDTHSETRTIPSHSAGRPLWQKILGTVIILAIVAGGAYLIYKYRDADNTAEQETPTADEIRQAFENNNQNNGAFNPSNSPFAGTSTSAPAATTTPPVAANNGAVQGSATYASWVYRDENTGIQFTLPGEWGMDNAQTTGGRTVFTNTKTPGQLAYLEAYATIGETLENVEKFLTGSPDVTGVTRTSVAGIPALRYTGRSDAKSGIALVHNSRVYYFHGALTDTSVLSSVSFF